MGALPPPSSPIGPKIPASQKAPAPPEKGKMGARKVEKSEAGVGGDVPGLADVHGRGQAVTTQMPTTNVGNARQAEIERKNEAFDRKVTRLVDASKYRDYALISNQRAEQKLKNMGEGGYLFRLNSSGNVLLSYLDKGVMKNIICPIVDQDDYETAEAIISMGEKAKDATIDKHLQEYIGEKLTNSRDYFPKIFRAEVIANLESIDKSFLFFEEDGVNSVAMNNNGKIEIYPEDSFSLETSETLPYVTRDITPYDPNTISHGMLDKSQAESLLTNAPKEGSWLMRSAPNGEKYISIYRNGKVSHGRIASKQGDAQKTQDMSSLDLQKLLKQQNLDFTGMMLPKQL